MLACKHQPYGRIRYARSRLSTDRSLRLSARTVRSALGRHQGTAFVALACVCGAAGILLSRQGLRTAPLLPFVFLQAAGGAFFGWSVGILLGVVPRFRELPRMALPGIFQPGMTHTMFFAALSFLPLALAGSLTSLETIFVVLLSYPLLGEKPNRLQVWLALAGLSGLVLLSWPGPVSGPHLILGIALVLGSVICASLDTIVSRRLAQQSHPVALAAVCSTSGMLVIALTLWFLPAGSWQVFTSPRLLGVTLGSGMLIHGAGASLFNMGLTRINATQAALLFPSISVMTAAGGMILFHERLALGQIAGAVVVMAAASAAGASMARR